MESTVEKVPIYTGRSSPTYVLRVNLCIDCPVRGLCCYHSKKFGNNNIITNPCRYLDGDRKLCTIYEERFTINPICLTIEEAITKGQLPKECLYVFNNKKYQKRIDIKRR